MKLLNNVTLVCGYTYSSLDNVYAIEGLQGTILVDTGTNEREYQTILDNLEYWGLPPVSHVIITHAHINHCFNAKRFQDQGAKLVCSAPVAEALEHGGNRLIDYHSLSLEYNIRTFQKCKADIVITDNGHYVIDGIDFDFRITNGHSAGGLVFFCESEGKRLMFTGDFMGIDSLNKHATLGWNGDEEYDADIYLQELKELSVEEPDAIFPGHYQQCLRDAWQLPLNAYLRALKRTHKDFNQ
ncbi:MAG: MBL fold metallo-hydrolase [Erysipelotrichaceae bacterium]|nr:MBL fold metallo-hydrolase [Erysipelotrichaceae bacterium]